MAQRKAKSGDNGTQGGAPAAATEQRRAAPRQTRAAIERHATSNRLLREAAWSRMFGRIEAKNPFTR